MIALAWSNPSSPPPVTEEMAGYDIGFSVGMFDKCGGKPYRTFDNVEQTDYNAGYVEGYLDGYCSNEVM